MSLQDLVTHSPKTYGEMEAEALRMETELLPLREALCKAEDRLNKANIRLDALKNLVNKEYEHLQSLIVQSSEGQIISLPEYREMKLRYNQNLARISETRLSLVTATKEIQHRKKAMSGLEAQLAALHSKLGNRGKLVQMRSASDS